MFSNSLLVALLAGVAAALPNYVSVRTITGNPFDAECKLDGCLLEVVASGLPIPSKALEACSPLLQKTVTPSSAFTITSYVTASQTPVTVTVTQTQPPSDTTLQLLITIVNNVGETYTVTVNVEETSTSVVTDRATTTGVDIASVTVTETSTAVHITATTTTQTVTAAIGIQKSAVPGKRQVSRCQKAVKGRCRHPQLPSLSLSSSTKVSSTDPLPTGCVDEAQLASACSCVYVTATATTGSVPTTVTTVTLTQRY